MSVWRETGVGPPQDRDGREHREARRDAREPAGMTGSTMRRKPYVPIFSSKPASSTEPAVGRGRVGVGQPHVQRPHRHLHGPGPRRSAGPPASCTPARQRPPATVGQRDEVGGAGEDRHEQDPDQHHAAAEQRHEDEPVRRPGAGATPPQPSMRNHIGASTTSKNTKNSTRSRLRNVPSARPKHQQHADDVRPGAVRPLGEGVHRDEHPDAGR